ncbi:hypothetical protein LEP1GSC192_2412 [Leptospira sp. B5-022]|nr:hypothetical protein LEP1GSC192_2412 [Leptospira sp. B5-022]
MQCTFDDSKERAFCYPDLRIEAFYVGSKRLKGLKSKNAFKKRTGLQNWLVSFAFNRSETFFF